ncbi:ABC transporter substrate-binding protein [Haloterrigena alkaliphila]|uniref:ABC transporter substrate-binding protein n=1 Tax=Haloterrigena alkaliphila TaxID=2816475 RepID=A0A8A2V862_9EURY|nr:ABC transporter substrate-binding protein [Haloterrigena alkaliphila]QSW97631.1 ABC transporter substrate-binding protein [Haloterrigena alkaliphila]
MAWDADDVRRRDVLKTSGALSAAGLTGLAGCAGTPGEQDTELGDEIHIGLVEPLSGVYANLGQAEIEGAQLAIQDLEEEFDITIETTEADTEADPDTGVRRIEELVTQDGIDAAFGGVSSSVAIAMGQWASRNDLAYIASGSHSDATTGGDCGQYMWRTASSNTMLARTAGAAMADHADSWTLVYADYTWGQTARDAVSEVLQNEGAEVVDTISVPLGAGDYSSALNRVQNSGAEAMGNITAGADTTRLCQQYLDSGLASEMKTGGVLLEDEVMWSLGPEGVAQMGVWATVWNPAYQEGQMGDFVERIRNEYQKTAYSRHYLGYTSMDQLVRAAIRAESTAAADIAGELNGHDYSDVGLLDGTQAWRECDHQNEKPTYAVQAKSADDMVDEDGERIWFEQVAKRSGEEVMRSCDETGCDL